MSDDITPNPYREGARAEDLDKQISALTEVVGGLASKVNKLRDRIDTLENGRPADADDDAKEHDQPGTWVLFTPPAAAEDGRHRKDGHDPNWTLDNFVAWFNATYVGLAGGPTKPIPECWRHHPGLAMEVATLAYTWRRANVGDTANVRDAQYWHHTWRPGFAARLTDWCHTHCLDGRHRETGSPVRPDRFTQRSA
ncbi:hypothetical protein AB8O55_23320 [Saccharopolyspora cebuensis]|uniref:Uncharacterized protein n=1 Tax=Saccharopolyspora cebuensis TaxID=418759 RepID=A0ABV4CMM5_9PSEU